MGSKDEFLFESVDSEYQNIVMDDILQSKATIIIKREDQLHDFVSGNKFRKLKYNIIEAIKKNNTCLLTFGGAYSNHIAATAYAGKLHNFKTIGIIRGEELSDTWHKNSTLRLAHEQGMRFKFLSRAAYRNKTSKKFINELRLQYIQEKTNYAGIWKKYPEDGKSYTYT